MKKNKLSSIKFKPLLMLGLVAVLQSCEQRDDWPHFDSEALTPTPPPKEEVDLNKTWYTETLESKGNTMFKRFVQDTVYKLHDGIEYTILRFVDGLDQYQKFHIIEADLNNPKIGITSMSAYGMALPNLQNLSNMTKDSEGKPGKIIAAINGDNIASNSTNAYGMPASGFVYNGKIMKAIANTTANIVKPYLGIKRNGEIVFGNSPSTATHPVEWIDQSEFEHQVFGLNFVVYGTWNNTANTDMISRSVVGINENENKIYFVVGDAHQTAIARGMGLPNIARIVRDLGITKAFLTNNSLYSQLVIRKEQTFNGLLDISFPLANLPMPYSGTGANTPATMANGIAIYVK